jgi:hypothetical protein
VWIGVSVKKQKIINLVIEKGTHRRFKSDEDAEKWAIARTSRLTEHIYFYSSAKYAIRTKDGNYIIGKANQK